MSEEHNEVYRHLIVVIGLCQTPRENWTKQDEQAIRDAREFIQEWQKSQTSEGD